MREIVSCVLKGKKMKNIICLLLIAFIVISCNKNDRTSGEIGNIKEVQKNEINSKPIGKVNFNIYIENSGSMDGYISQPSEFKDVLRSFTSDIRPNFGVYPGFYFVNNKGAFDQFPNNPTPDYYKFIADLSPNNSKIRFPPGGDSSIDDIINFSTQNMKNKISIVFSDCVLSYKQTGSEGAKTAEANIKDFMADKIEKQKLSTIVIKFNSKFKGSYYNESNGGVGIAVNKNINRPFYALIFGETPALEYLLSKINFSKYPGFEASYTLLANNREIKPESIITRKNKTGDFRIAYPASNMKIINAEEKKGSTDFQFSINVNLKDLPFQNDFLMEKSNYFIDNNFKVVSINKLDDTDEYSHTISFKTNSLKQNSKLNFGINYSIPNWVSKTGSDKDDNPSDSLQQKQTFGFKYLMLGLSEAYVAKNDDLQLRIPITINKNAGDNNNPSNFPWWIFIVIVSILGLFIYFKNKK
jgi:hypothetical protein